MNWNEFGQALETYMVPIALAALGVSIVLFAISERKRRKKEHGDAMFREANRHDDDNDPTGRLA